MWNKIERDSLEGILGYLLNDKECDEYEVWCDEQGVDPLAYREQPQCCHVYAMARIVEDWVQHVE